MSRHEINPGTSYGKLVVIRELASGKKRRFLCRCDCGEELSVRLDHLRSGHSTSCGKCGILYLGQRKSLRQWAKAYKIKESTLRLRLKTMSMGEAVQFIR